jgi:hypothetical protein
MRDPEGNLTSPKALVLSPGGSPLRGFFFMGLSRAIAAAGCRGLASRLLRPVADRTG